MKQLFALKNAWLGIASKKLLSGIVIASIAVGLAFPVAVLTRINYYDKYYWCELYNDVEHTVVIDSLCDALEEEKFRELMSVPDCGITDVGFFATYSTTQVFKGDSRITNIAGCNASYLEVGKTKLLNGRYPTAEEITSGAKVCVSKESTHIGENIRVGDTVTLAGTDFEVIGIIRDVELYGSFLIPYNALLALTDMERFQYMSYLETAGTPDMDAIKTYFRLEETVDPLQMLTAVEAQENYTQRGNASIKRQLAVNSVIALFSIISFTLIIVGKVLGEQYGIGVKTAMGATKGQLFWELTLQNFILIEIAAVIAIFLSCGMISLVPNFNGLFGGEVVISTEILAVLLTFIITAVAFIPILNRPIT